MELVKFNNPTQYVSSLANNEYLILLVFLVIAVVITTLIISTSYFLAKQNPEAEKLSAYECGFEPYEDAGRNFDIKFCVIAILFIIFDIELMFLIHGCVSISNVDLLGFFYVWYVNALNWELTI